ncbi:helix-turn-helix transcriptional regulator [Blautia producta]|uniref:helix-turn-helix domain-containing protein n=1 Tax=Blautia producta TaxID=33035 RepID=UPI001D016930|nr:helix-turn-helix domain-containing protein [Blautia producta]MCB5873844.1 helix-turn-helix transcriptional regulator [Blautia producta]
MNCANDSLLKNISLSELKIDNKASPYAEQYKLNGPYMLIYTNYDLGSNEAFYSLIAPGLCRYKTLHMNSDYIKNRFMHQHDFFEFMFVIHGHIVHKIENKTYSYQEGQCCLVNHNVRHTEIAGDNAEVMFLAISNTFFLNLIRFDIQYDETGHVILQKNTIYDLVLKTFQTGNSAQKQYWNFSPTGDSTCAISEFERLFGMIIRETAGRRPGLLPLVSGLIARIFSILLDPEQYSLQKFTLPSDKEEYLFLRIQELLTQTNGCISRHELSVKLHYDPDYMNKIVKKYTGMSLLKYGRSFTLKESARLLTYTDMNISDIMQRLGFTNRNHFYTIFKEKYGITPNKYRRKNSETTPKQKIPPDNHTKQK